jgi:hypothetical protein
MKRWQAGREVKKASKAINVWAIKRPAAAIATGRLLEGGVQIRLVVFKHGPRQVARCY